MIRLERKDLIGLLKIVEKEDRENLRGFFLTPKNRLCVTNGRILAGYHLTPDEAATFKTEAMYPISAKFLSLNKNNKYVDIDATSNGIMVDGMIIQPLPECQPPRADIIYDEQTEEREEVHEYVVLDPNFILAMDKFWPGFWKQTPSQKKQYSPCVWENRNQTNKFIFIMPIRR